MADVRLIKHEAVPNCGSYEVRFSDGRPSQYFYWDDQRLRPDLLTGERALEQAKAFARAERTSIPVLHKPKDTGRNQMSKFDGISGIVWILREDYEEMRAISSDLPGTFDEWREDFLKKEQDEIEGHKIVQRVAIDPYTFPDWCQKSGARPDREGRNKFVEIEIAEVTRQFMADMRLFHAQPDETKRDEIAARQLLALRRTFTGELRLSDVKEMFEEMKDQA